MFSLFGFEILAQVVSLNGISCNIFLAAFIKSAGFSVIDAIRKCNAKPFFSEIRNRI